MKKKVTLKVEFVSTFSTREIKFVIYMFFF